MISEEAKEIARRRADEDRALLARLLREGRAGRDAELGKNVPGAAEFRHDIEGLVSRPVNTAIRRRKRRR